MALVIGELEKELKSEQTKKWDRTIYALYNTLPDIFHWYLLKWKYQR